LGYKALSAQVFAFELIYKWWGLRERFDIGQELVPDRFDLFF
jgi:hypothetical protein